MLSYVYSRLIRDEDTQRQGIVVVLWMLGGGDIKKNFYSIVQKSEEFDHSMPARAAVLHVCYNNPVARTALSLFHVAINSKHRTRLRAHYGECFALFFTLFFLVFVIPNGSPRLYPPPKDHPLNVFTNLWAMVSLVICCRLMTWRRSILKLVGEGTSRLERKKSQKNSGGLP